MCVGRDMAFSKLKSRVLAVAEAVQAAKLHHEMTPEQQAIMPSAGGPGTDSTWTAMNKSSTGLMQTARWRVATSLRLGMPPDARAPCEGEMRARSSNSHLRRTRTTPSAASTKERGPDRTEGTRLSSTTGGHRSPVKTLLSRVQLCTSPGFCESCSNSGSTSVCGARMQNVTVRQERLRREEKRRRRSDMVLVCARWFSEPVADWAERAPGDDCRGERAMHPTRCWKMADRIGEGADVCSGGHVPASSVQLLIHTKEL